METPESIERMLHQRLVPGALSDSGSSSLEQLVDELAEESPRHATSWTRLILGGGAAAAAVVAFMLALPADHGSPADGEAGLFAENRDVVLLEDVEGVIYAEPSEGLVADADGSLHRAWHVQVVSSERFRDEQSGEEVTVVHPRDEVVLMPVTAF